MAQPSVAKFLGPPLGVDRMLVRRVHAHSALGRLYEVRLELLRKAENPDKSEKAKVKAEKLLGLHAGVEIPAAQNKYRYINGIVTEFERGGRVGRFDIYRLTLRPWLWQLTLTTDMRIFQNKTAVQIIDEVFAEYGAASKVEKKLEGSFEKRPFTVQYRETDFNFVSRLMEQEGIYYYFKHEADHHTLVLCNGASGHSDSPVPKLSWSPSLKEDKERLDIITHWHRSHSLQPLKSSRTDFAAESPTTSLMAESRKRSVPYPSPSAQYKYETYGYPGGHDDMAMTSVGGKVARGKAAAELLTDRYESAHSIAEALTLEPMLALGQTFTLDGEHEDKGKYLTTSTVQALEYTGYEAADEATDSTYECRFDAVLATVKYQPQPWSEPVVVNGPQTATVTGTSGSEIYTEEYGRVKVRFHWDRRGASDETSSCWARVAFPWASKGFGFVTLPRVGDEVVIEFLDGNPDYPVVTGSVYNGTNKPPYALPAHATVSGIRSRSSKGGSADNFNELRFEDDKGKEYVWFQAEKDFHQLVKNDAYASIKNNLWTDVTKNTQHQIGENLTMTVGKVSTIDAKGDAHIKLGADLNTAITGAFNLKVTGESKTKVVENIEISTDKEMHLDVLKAFNLTAGATLHLKATAGVVIDGGTQLCIKAGAGFVLLGPDGVTIQGPIVKINSGGSAGSANEATKAEPTTPKEPGKQEENKDPLAGGNG